MPEIVDISEHQGVLPSDWFGQWDAAILRAFNENGFPDSVFAQNWRNAAGRTRRGVYGWPIPGADNRVLGAQLVAVAPDAEFGYWADVERSGRGIAGAADVEHYLAGIGDRVRGFYSNIGECPRSPMLELEDWWMADYGPNDGHRHDPFEQAPVPARGWVLHQYTSAGGLDRNYADSLDFADVTTEEDDDMKGTLIQQEGTPFLWLFANGVRLATADRTHADLIHLFGQSDNDADHPAVISAEQMAAIPEWKPTPEADGPIVASFHFEGTAEATP